MVYTILSKVSSSDWIIQMHFQDENKWPDITDYKAKYKHLKFKQRKGH